MADLFDNVLKNAMLVAVALAVIGAVLSLLGVSTPGAVAFMFAGIFVMYASGQREPTPD